MYDYKKLYTVVAIFVTIIVLVCIGLIANELSKINLDNRSKAATIYSYYDIDRTIDDRSIDIRDFSAFIRNYGSTNCGNIVDFNHDCKVNISDYAMFRIYYGSSY